MTPEQFAQLLATAEEAARGTYQLASTSRPLSDWERAARANLDSVETLRRVLTEALEHRGDTPEVWAQAVVVVEEIAATSARILDGISAPSSLRSTIAEFWGDFRAALVEVSGQLGAAVGSAGLGALGGLLPLLGVGGLAWWLSRRR